MVVKLLNKILEDYPLNKAVKVQFVTHKKDSFWSDEVYEDCVLVTPIAHDGEELYYRSRYVRCSALRNWELRDAFSVLVKRYNVANFEKPNFTRIIMDSNYCTIK